MPMREWSIAKKQYVWFHYNKTQTGLEVDPTLLRSNIRNSAIISITAMVVPFAIGIGVSAYIYYEVGVVSYNNMLSIVEVVG